ncbi:tetratricopeptide repeat protein [Cytobacillus suaedae]|nr:tetratricopeptide repeat protein [Cytobacillus suaedae]
MNNQSNDRKARVIQFPKLKERLLDKGMDAIKDKNYKHALDLLSQAKEIDSKNDEIEFGIVMCLFEMGRLEEAKQGCKRMLLEDIGDYFNVLQFYLTILIQLGEYTEVKTTLEAVFQEDQVPPQHAENLYQLLEFSRRYTSNREEITDDVFEDENKYEQVHRILLEETDTNEQIKLLHTLKDSNISKYLEPIQQYLIDPTKNVIIKTMIIQLLIDHSIEKEITVEKLGEEGTVIPSKLTDIIDNEHAQQALKALEEMLANDNPSLFEVCKEMWFRYLYVTYPFQPKAYSSNTWAAALHMYGSELHGIEIDIVDLKKMYGDNIDYVNHALETLKEIEKISFLEI